MYAPTYQREISPGYYPPYPVVRNLLNGLWELVDPVTYLSPDGRAWTAPAGLLTDWGSVPAVVDWIIPANSTKADLPYLFHDLMYYRHRIGKDVCRDRQDADGILYEALRLVGVGRVKALTIYWAVRAAGWKAWGRSR